MIMAGGTGGHIFPGLAVADLLRARDWRVVWMGNPAGMEARVVPARGIALAPVDFGGLRGKGLATMLLLPLRLIRAFWQSLAALRRVRPSVVLGMGGYVTFPGGMMAALLGRPLVLHEQNSIAGLANRVLAGVADAVLVAFPDAFAARRPFGGTPAPVHCGNPVSAAIAAQPAPAQRFEGRAGPLRLLVVGGSLGARALNEVVPAALTLLPTASRPSVRHQSGEKEIEALRANYAKAGLGGADGRVQAVAFIDDMASAYAEADLVIARAGAMTVSEIACVGVASVLVPYPHAVDDHQTTNARYLADRGAALLVAQDALDARGLADLIAGLDRARLLEMAERARALGKPDAAREVAEVCEGLAR
ncbi:MAG: undecaprenyldiphospho-muramoylpentapeptide beta-N-acetylglucosaminyltransferase [Lautropia sp.]